MISKSKDKNNNPLFWLNIGSEYEISINIAPKKRSKGLGKIILRKTIKYLFDEEEKCQILPAWH